VGGFRVGWSRPSLKGSREKDEEPRADLVEFNLGADQEKKGAPAGDY